MAPGKSQKNAKANNKIGASIFRKSGLSQNQNSNKRNVPAAKRKADGSPKKEKATKRSAFGDITNVKEAGDKSNAKEETKKIMVTQGKMVTVSKAKVVKIDRSQNQRVKGRPQIRENVPPPADGIKPKEPSDGTSTLKSATSLAELPVIEESKVPIAGFKFPTEGKSSVECESRRSSAGTRTSEENSLYVSALEDVSEDTLVKENNEKNLEHKDSDNLSGKSDIKEIDLEALGIHDFDKENWNDPFQVSHYAMDIFNYLKSREGKFIVAKYMDKQPYLNKWMRALLVDWMVEVQESFELNHETLYLAVKLVDMYLSHVQVPKEALQLLGATSLFIACKYDERVPPLINDFLYICDDAYSQRELLKLEKNILRVLDFDLGIPLSYRFLRRYARCAKASMPTLTLARYILEYSLMEYQIIHHSDSKLAAAALFLALKMTKISNWTPTLRYYSGYDLEDIIHIARELNAMLHQKPKEALKTIRNKYSHKLFYEVAKTPLISSLDDKVSDLC